MLSARHASRRTLRIGVGACALMFVVLVSDPAHADAALGFRERFGAIHGWGGGAIYQVPSTGGVDGDGFLLVTTEGGPGPLATRSFDPEYLGDWTAAGITQIRLWLKDVNADDPLQIHVAVGGGANLWLHAPAFLPPENAWAEFVVDLTNPSNFTQIINAAGGTYAQALQDAQVLHVRHDLAPFVQMADAIEADFGIDNILLTNGVVGVGDVPGVVARALEVGAPWPNPSRGPVAFTLTQHQSAPVEIAVFDVTGRRVRRASLAASGTGPRTWMWDGADDRGARVAPGAYRVSIRDASGGMSRPMIRID